MTLSPPPAGIRVRLQLLYPPIASLPYCATLAAGRFERQAVLRAELVELYRALGTRDRVHSITAARIEQAERDGRLAADDASRLHVVLLDERETCDHADPLDLRLQFFESQGWKRRPALGGDPGDAAPVAESTEGVLLDRVAPLRVGHEGTGSRSDCRLGGGDVDVPGIGLDVDENDLGAEVEGGGRGRVEGDGRAHDLVARAEVQREEGRVEGHGPGGAEERVLAPEAARQLLLAAADHALAALDGERLAAVDVGAQELPDAGVARRPIPARAAGGQHGRAAEEGEAFGHGDGSSRVSDGRRPREDRLTGP
jgi:hypothetical protein